MADIAQMAPKDVKERLDRKDDFILIDVRENDEWNICRVAGAALKPMSRIMQWIGELDPDKEYVFMCHHGKRSYQVCAFAQANGIAKVANLAGGIEAWSDTVDRSVPKY